MFKGENYSPVPVTGDALIIVDVQNDFLPKGSLPVPNGDAVVPVLNRYLVEFENRGLPVFNTRDWHLEGVMQEDVICLEDEIMEGSALLHPVMKEGRRLYPRNRCVVFVNGFQRNYYIFLLVCEI